MFSYSHNRHDSPHGKAEPEDPVLPIHLPGSCISLHCCRVYFLLLVFLLLIGFPGCTKLPLVQLGSSRMMMFTDDGDRKSLCRAIRHSLTYLENSPATKTFKVGSRIITTKDLHASLTFFLELLQRPSTAMELNRQLATYFDFFQATGVSGLNFQRRMLVTGYYQPLVEGSLKREPPFIYPLYDIPDDLVVKTDLTGKKQGVGRFEGIRFSPYWTRKEIETQGKANGHELVWLKDPMDAYTIHIQGSSLIRLRDNTIRGIHYAISNGRDYASIGKYMVDTGKMRLEDASMDAIRSYLRKHPQESDDILFRNESYIFFRWTDTHGAIGSLGEELTAGRSVAVDQTIFPAGGLGFLVSRQPHIKNGRVVAWDELSRFVLFQDCGSAIRGPGRVDYFLGTGHDAGLAASRMKEDGKLFFLLLKPAYLNHKLATR